MAETLVLTSCGSAIRLVHNNDDDDDDDDDDNNNNNNKLTRRSTDNE